MNSIFSDPILIVAIISNIVSAAWIIVVVWIIFKLQVNTKRMTSALNKMILAIDILNKRINKVNEYLVEKDPEFK